MVPRAPSAPQHPDAGPDPESPLCALEELASKTFLGHDLGVPQPSEGTLLQGAGLELNLSVSLSLCVSLSLYVCLCLSLVL